MTSRQHQDWINHGRPDSGLVKPLQKLATKLSSAGYVVYTFPNDAHLDAEPPEDHTYYSETGWPGSSPKWWRHAIDIMPPPSGRGLPSLTQIGQTIFNARQAGQITWLKYMNWPSDGNLSRAVQDRWEPNHQRGSSSDTGHIHLSSITGCEVLDSNFDPFTSIVLTGQVTAMAHTIDEIYDTLTAIANGNQPTAGGHSEVPVWVRTMQDLAPRLDSILTTLAKLSLAVDEIKAQLGTPAPTGDLAVTGTLHLGGTS
jgi:hypothetical protein